VRQFGKSYAHPFLVLVVMPNQEETSRFGITAGRSVGKAVQRNRAKRRLRAALQSYLSLVSPGWDVVLIARRPMLEAAFPKIQAATAMLLQRAGVLDETYEP
jgi:ribonuclease P protein component